jgi:hypothetical protein
MNACTRYLGIYGFLSLMSLAAVAGEDRDRWLGRPWEFSYVIQIDTAEAMTGWRMIGQKKLLSRDPKKSQIPAAVFDWVKYSIPKPGRLFFADDGHIAVLSIKFDKSGRVVTPYAWQPGLRGGISKSLYVELALNGDSREGLHFDLGYWYTGRSSDEAMYVPAICSVTDMDGRYKQGFDRNSSTEGGFGCREWGYYLQSPAHPYIDITSYQKQGAYIRPVVGWGRFDIPAKPVIGKVLDTWLCLYDCPDDEAPGVIPDISAWAEKRNWPIPKPPKRLPMFVEKARKAGEFVD